MKFENKKKEMKKITSLQNPDIKAAVKLHQAKERNKKGLFIAEGMRTCQTLIDAGWQPAILFATFDMLENATKMTQKSRIYQVTPAIINKISSTKSPSGLVAIFPIPKPPAPQKLSAGMVLAHINDPGNMGTLIRTCAAMGKKSVVIINGTDVWNSKVIQASAGTIALVNIFSWSWQECVKQANAKKLPIYCLITKNGNNIDTIKQPESLLVIGSEAHGIKSEWLKECTQQLTIKMPGKAESLNAAIAGAIAMYVIWGTK